MVGAQLFQTTLIVDIVDVPSATHHQIVWPHIAQRKSQIEWLEFYPSAFVYVIDDYVEMVEFNLVDLQDSQHFSWFANIGLS